MCTRAHVGVCSTGATTKSSEAVLSKGEGSRTHYSLMSSTPLLSLPLLITLQLPPTTPFLSSLLSAFSSVLFFSLPLSILSFFFFFSLPFSLPSFVFNPPSQEKRLVVRCVFSPPPSPSDLVFFFSLPSSLPSLVITPASHCKSFVREKSLTSGGLEKARQNRLLCFYLGEIRRGSRMQQKAVIWRHQIRSVCTKSRHTAHKSNEKEPAAPNDRCHTATANRSSCISGSCRSKVLMKLYIIYHQE